jgi:hypothetical protein
MDLKSLKEFLKNSPIKIVEKKPKTFLEISKQPHYENVISNIYGFFLDVYEEHGLGDLFISSLIDCINSNETIKKKIAIENFRDFSIDLEYSTDNNGRIDILISSYESAIIIENKVYHFLNNDLKDYWETIIKKGVKPEKSIGIILSLIDYKDIEHEQFIGITHIQLLNKVFDNIGKYLLTCNEKYLPFLKDLYQNIQNLTKQNMTAEELDLFSNN